MGKGLSEASMDAPGVSDYKWCRTVNGHDMTYRSFRSRSYFPLCCTVYVLFAKFLTKARKRGSEEARKRGSEEAWKIQRILIRKTTD